MDFSSASIFLMTSRAASRSVAVSCAGAGDVCRMNNAASDVARKDRNRRFIWFLLGAASIVRQRVGCLQCFPEIFGSRTAGSVTVWHGDRGATRYGDMHFRPVERLIFNSTSGSVPHKQGLPRIDELRKTPAEILRII